MTANPTEVLREQAERALKAASQEFGADPTKVRESDHYQAEYIQGFVEKWDELIDWESRAERSWNNRSPSAARATIGRRTSTAVRPR